MLNKNKIVVYFFVICLISISLVGHAIASPVSVMTTKNITVQTGVNVYVNDVPIDAGNTNGNPSAFIYNGTTYVAVSAVSNSLGQSVKWDGSTASVFIGKHGDDTTYLMDVCEPYEGKGYKIPSTVTMAGQKYAHCLDLANHGGFAIFNLNGKYTSLNFKFGRIDNIGDKADGILEIYLDGNLYDSIDIAWNSLPKEMNIPLNGALQMELRMVAYGNMAHYGFGEIIVK